MIPKTLLAAVIGLAAILSLSAFAYAYASTSPSSDDSSAPAEVKNEGGHHRSDITKCFGPCNNNDGSGGSSTDSGGSHHHSSKIGKIDRLFRSDSADTGQAALDSIPVIQPLTPEQLNGTNLTKTATVTIPVCDGVVGGPCLDETTGQIIP
jgi:hypothetical protein